MKSTVTLTDKTDAYNFHRKAVMVVVPGSDFRLRSATRRERARFWLHDQWLSATRWFRSRTVTSEIDVEAGSITLVTERWSWARWRWERA